MKYQLIENYFATSLFQRVVGDYFDTVLGRIIAENATTSAKGLFIVDGEQKRDYYDMPYHVHILNGLIPALFVYEQYMKSQGFDTDPDAEIYLRVFILGFTFHDANKLLGVSQTREKADLEVAVEALDGCVELWGVHTFLPEFDRYKSNVYYLALSTESGTWAMAEDYPITLGDGSHVRGIQRELCHLADGLASIQNESLESIEALHKAVDRRIQSISKIAKLSVSYVKVRPNPYTLLGQNLLQVARKVLAGSGKKVLFSLREGFIFWGDDITATEYDQINQDYLSGSADDIKCLELTKLDYQSCSFGFLGSAPFTQQVLSEITSDLADRFLALSPNTDAKINDFDGFVKFTKQIIEAYQLPIECNDKEGRLVLWYFENLEEETDQHFQTIFNLHKIQWLNAKENKGWHQDFNDWVESTADLAEPIAFETGGQSFALDTVPALLSFIQERVSSTNALYKTYLNFIKTWQVMMEEEAEEYIAALQEEIISHFEPEVTDEATPHIKQAVFDRYFECPGHANLQFLDQYAPAVPVKKEMCAFTGGIGRVAYKAEVAFAMKARGFCNRTVTALNNNTSYISALFAEENKLRASLFRTSDANMVMYNDFFEARLDLDRDIIQSCVKAKSEVKLLKDGVVEFDKNAKFQYNLYNLDFIKLAPKVEPTFFHVRKCLRMAAQLGIRTYISGIMTPYTPHKAIFHFDNAPRFLKLLGWDSVRLIHLEEVLDEMYLVLLFGKDRIESNLLKIAKSRGAFFTLYYLLGDKEQQKVAPRLINFYQKYKDKFKDMTVTEKLVELAVKVDVGFKSGAEETWLIRTAMEYLRKYHKQGNSREDIIQKTCGEIYRKLRMKGYDTEAIEDFAAAVYDDLFLKDWKGKIPTVNVEKDWIYQFAFLFKAESLATVKEYKALKMLKKLKADSKEISKEDIRQLMPNATEKLIEEYLEIIKKLNKDK